MILKGFGRCHYCNTAEHGHKPKTWDFPVAPTLSGNPVPVISSQDTLATVTNSPIPLLRNNSKLLSWWVVPGPLRKLFYFLSKCHGEGLIPGRKLCSMSLLCTLPSWWSHFHFHPLNSSSALPAELFFRIVKWIYYCVLKEPPNYSENRTHAPFYVSCAFTMGSNLPSLFISHPPTSHL